MPIAEGTPRLKSLVAEYDFAVDGGAVSTITLRSSVSDAQGNVIPNGSVIEGGYVDIATQPTSGTSTATIAVQAEAANDIVNAVVISNAQWNSAARKSVIPAFTGLTGVKTTAERNVKIVIAVEALTAGKFKVVLFYR
jgi:hypothetical protein